MRNQPHCKNQEKDAKKEAMKKIPRVKIRPDLKARIKGLRRMRAEWGEKCIECDGNCICCSAWKIFEKNGYHPSIEDVICLSSCSVKYRAGSD